MTDDLHRLTHLRAAHHAGYDVEWTDADEARYQALALPPEQRVARERTDDEAAAVAERQRDLLDRMRQKARADLAKATEGRR